MIWHSVNKSWDLTRLCAIFNRFDMHIQHTDAYITHTQSELIIVVYFGMFHVPWYT